MGQLLYPYFKLGLVKEGNSVEFFQVSLNAASDPDEKTLAVLHFIRVLTLSLA